MEKPENITRAELQEWKVHKVTLAFFEAMMNQRESVLYILEKQAGLNTTQDNFHRGYLMAISDFMEANVEESPADAQDSANSESRDDE